MNVTCIDAVPGKRSGPRRLRPDETPSLLVQLDGTKICGPCCVAMALDTDLGEALRLCKSKGGGTRTSQVVAALQTQYHTANKLMRAPEEFTSKFNGNAILKVTFKNRRSGHWVLLWQRFIYDPGWGAFPVENWFDSVLTHTNGRVTSYLPIWSNHDRTY